MKTTKFYQSTTDENTFCGVIYGPEYVRSVVLGNQPNSILSIALCDGDLTKRKIGGAFTQAHTEIVLGKKSPWKEVESTHFAVQFHDVMEMFLQQVSEIMEVAK